MGIRKRVPHLVIAVLPDTEGAPNDGDRGRIGKPGSQDKHGSPSVVGEKSRMED